MRAEHLCRTGADGLAPSQQAQSTAPRAARGAGAVGRRGRQELAQDSLSGAAAVLQPHLPCQDPSTEL